MYRQLNVTATILGKNPCDLTFFVMTKLFRTSMSLKICENADPEKYRPISGSAIHIPLSRESREKNVFEPKSDVPV
jgi:hypothetical protein